MKWLKLHAKYDDAHPWEALEIIVTLVATPIGKPSASCAMPSAESPVHAHAAGPLHALGNALAHAPLLIPA
jgi:hypothetical protein